MRPVSILISSIIILFFACQNASDSKVENNAESQMYKPSELALLMKQMHNQHLAWKTLAIKDSLNDVMPQEFLGIYSVTPTDSNIRNQVFNHHADYYLKKVKKLMSAKNQKKQITLYNASIDACINCHNDFCTGPIDKIKKLYIDN